MRKYKLLKFRNLVCKWYVCSIILIVLYYLISFCMDSNTYYKLSISLVIIIFVFIDLFIVPLIVTLNTIKMRAKNY